MCRVVNYWIEDFKSQTLEYIERLKEKEERKKKKKGRGKGKEKLNDKRCHYKG